MLSTSNVQVFCSPSFKNRLLIEQQPLLPNRLLLVADQQLFCLIWWLGWLSSALNLVAQCLMQQAQRLRSHVCPGMPPNLTYKNCHHSIRMMIPTSRAVLNAWVQRLKSPMFGGLMLDVIVDAGEYVGGAFSQPHASAIQESTYILHDCPLNSMLYKSSNHLIDSCQNLERSKIYHDSLFHSTARGFFLFQLLLAKEPSQDKRALRGRFTIHCKFYLCTTKI